VGIGAEKYFAGTSVALLRERGVTDSGIMRAVLTIENSFAGIEDPMTIRVVNHVIKIGDPLLFYEIAQNIHIAVGFGIGRENVVIGNDNDLGTIPDFGVLAEFAFEDADRAGATNVMGHQYVSVDPDVVAGLDGGFAGGTGEDFFSKCHISNRSTKEKDSRRARRLQLSSAQTSVVAIS
jgi:hypothetical protein